MKVTLIARTLFMTVQAESIVEGWEAEDDGASSLSEFAGRECYQSWTRPNPATASNDGYLLNIIRQGHTSVLEHGGVSFRIEGVSRACTHELVRHRHFSYSQLSQRYVSTLPDKPVIPPLWRDMPGGEAIRAMMEQVWTQQVELYQALIDDAEAAGVSRKEARQAARAVLPNMTPTSLVMTGNHLAWRQMLLKRLSPHADAEIRELAQEILRQLIELEPALYQDFPRG